MNMRYSTKKVQIDKYSKANISAPNAIVSAYSSVGTDDGVGRRNVCLTVFVNLNFFGRIPLIYTSR